MIANFEVEVKEEFEKDAKSFDSILAKEISYAMAGFLNKNGMIDVKRIPKKEGDPKQTVTFSCSINVNKMKVLRGVTEKLSQLREHPNMAHRSAKQLIDECFGLLQNGDNNKQKEENEQVPK